MPTLREIFSNTADAIRSKTGKSESIYPVDMASEIEGIESGGYKLEKMPSGAVSSFNDGTDLPLNKLKVSIEPVQSGSGDPSPTNIRPISGWTECEVTVTDDLTTPTETKTYNIEFKDGDNPLTVYGGTLDVTNGVLTVNRVMIDLGTLNYSMLTVTQGTLFRGDLANVKKTSGSSETPNILCSNYKTTTQTDRANLTISQPTASANVDIIDNSYSSASDFKTAMNGVQVVYELATPQTYQLNPTAVKSLLGTNNIWADTGDIINGEYFKGAESSGSGIIYYIKNIRIKCEVI